MRILIVDDVPSNRILAASMLKRLGWDTCLASDGPEALEMLAMETVDAILLDISMPKLSGDEVCRKIRRDPALAGLPVVAYTAHGLDEEISQILSAGFDCILVKPVNLHDLQQAIDQAMQARKGGG